MRGACQEGIVATALVYYDSSNITPSALGFRRPLNAGEDYGSGSNAVDYEQNDVKGVEEIYGVKIDRVERKVRFFF